MSSPLLFTHLFWDFDGTLYDSYPQMTGAMLSALKEMDIILPEPEVYRLIKRSVRSASAVLEAQYSLPPKTLFPAFQKYHDVIASYPIFEDTEPCLRHLHSLGCRHYLYTHRNRSAVRQLEKDGLSSLFSGFVTHEDGYPDKPAPDALLAMMAKYGAPEKSSVIIGDRDLDILSGHNAGIQGILFDPADHFPDVSAEYRIQSLSQIIPLLSVSADMK